MRKAKIVCTLGPASQTLDVLVGMIRGGMDVARFNFSHGTHEDHVRRLAVLRRAAGRAGRTVAVLQDVQGPKVRLGGFEGGQMPVRKGERVIVTTRRVLGHKGVIPTPIDSLPKDVAKGDEILVDDGRVRLRVERVRGRDIVCRVLVGGVVKDHKGLNLPGVALSVPTITRKDREDLAFGRELGVDYVALSFVRTAEDVLQARALVGPGTPLIAKIEKPQAVENLDAIARAADGVMIARGDLGVEMPLERIPAIQKDAVARVNAIGGVVIVATEMLESMIHNPRPTRAEVSDVANAVLDGADAVMLSGETAVGRYPIEAVATMCRIVEETESAGKLRINHPLPSEETEISAGVAAAAAAAAQQMKAEIIVAYTESGYTARLVSEFRPRARILGLTPNEETTRRMALYWGVTPMHVGRLRSTDAMVRQVKRLCAERGLCAGGSPVVIVAGVPLNQPGRTNTMTVHQV